MNEELTELIESLTKLGIQSQSKVDLSKITWLKTGGVVDLLIQPEEKEQLVQVLRVLLKAEMPYRVIGATSNLLFLDDHDYGVLVSTVRIDQISLDEENLVLKAEVGALLPDLSRAALVFEIDGFGGLEGIPGTIGGAVFMNAGAYGDGIHRVLKSIEVFMPDGEIQSLEADALDLSYRNSIFRDGRSQGVILSATFHARSGNAAAIERKMELVHSKRHKYNDYAFPNLGSAFAGSVYRYLGKRSAVYHFVASVYYFLNYRFKIFRRESPLNRKWLNDFTIKHFKIRADPRSFSNKTLNSIVNRGQGTGEIVRYLEELDSLVGPDLSLENEIVRGKSTKDNS